MKRGLKRLEDEPKAARFSVKCLRNVTPLGHPLGRGKGKLTHRFLGVAKKHYTHSHPSQSYPATPKGSLQAAVTLVSANRSYRFLALQTSDSKKALGQDVTRASRCKEVTSHAKVIAGFDHPNSR